MRTKRLILGVVNCLLLLSVTNYTTHAASLSLINKACPKQWESLTSDMILKPGVLDIWQGDLSDKAQFIQYANEQDEDGKPRLMSSSGELLIDSYSDPITILTECAAQRVQYYRAIREQNTGAVSSLVSQLEGHTAFSASSLSSGVDYTDWVSNTTPGFQQSQQAVPENLSIGRDTSQSGTTSEELALLDLENNPDNVPTEEEYGEMAKNSGYASNAVDNNTDGKIANGSVTYTGFQDQPFWQVDLDDVVNIESITIYRRTDDTENLLRDYYVIVSDTPITQKSLDAAKADRFVVGGGAQPAFSNSHKVFNFDEPIKGKYVRIQLSESNTVLSLAEVIVMGYPAIEVSDQELERVFRKTGT